MPPASTIDLRKKIQSALNDFSKGSLLAAARNLFRELGYKSQRDENILQIATPDDFLQWLESANQHNALSDKNRIELQSHLEKLHFIFQLTDAEIRAALAEVQGNLFDSGTTVDGSRMQSYLVFAASLAPDVPGNRSTLARLVRLINKPLPMPAIILFQHGDTLSLGVINRRIHKSAPDRDVVEKVTLIKDIDCTQTHRAHIEILSDLALEQLRQRHGFTNFIELHDAWRKTLDTSELNKRFFKEIADWYFWAIHNVTFPKDAGRVKEARNAVSVIRLITRLIFVWFIKEKRLVSEDLFDRRKLGDILNFSDPQGSTYYKAILQNLFFATLNQEMNTKENPDRRKFRHRAKQPGQRDPHYMIHNVYRYQDAFKNPAVAISLFSSIPFLNGGLFECLDKPDPKDPQNMLRIDGFSDHPKNELVAPDFLFFSPKIDVDLNADYGTKNKRYTVRGLIGIFEKYKFTIHENTPVEEEIALDPELLGKVFENLLAAYNPVTGGTARKQTGSFYTPREIVNDMVDEALIAYLEAQLAKDPALHKEQAPPASDLNERLRHLFSYTEKPHRFSAAETKALLAAIDNIKILDLACGSGAFPMGVLHRLVFILAKLDPRNAGWRQRQIDKVNAAIRAAERIDDDAIREGARKDLEQQFAHIEDAFTRNELDYGRKLYLIEHCIYGVDIQPIAVQIAKLRFFISLIVDQKTDDSRENRGIRPLPNLETKFVAANTLLGIEKPKHAQYFLRSQDIDDKEKELAEVRKKHFTARTPATKVKHRELDAKIRSEIAALLKQERLLPLEAAKKLALWDPYDQNAFSDFFDPEWMFGITDGFDITIGNPPYVRADSGEDHLTMRRAIEKSGQYQTLWEKWDLYIPFIERGYQLLKPGGVTTMIVSDAFCHSKYAQKAQTWFLKNACIRRLDFFSNIQIFDAAVRNITYLFRRTDGTQNRPERRVHGPEFGMVRLLPTAEQANLTYRAFFPEDEENNHFTSPTLALAEICYISVGMVVHADEKVAKGAFIMEDLVADNRDAIHPKPFVEGKHLDRWLPSDRKWLEWGTERAPALFRRPTFPELYEVKEKILALRISGKDIRVSFDDQQLLCNHTAIVCEPWHSLAGVRNKSIKKAARYQGEKPPRPDLPRREDLEKTGRRFAVKYLLAVMNSSAARDFLQSNRRSNTDLYPEDWKQLPIPDATPDQQSPLIRLVDQILVARRTDPHADVTAIEQELDILVSQLYGLQQNQSVDEEKQHECS